MVALLKKSMIIGLLLANTYLCAEMQKTSTTAKPQAQVTCSAEELENLVALAKADPTAQPKAVSDVQAWLRKIGCIIVLKYFSAKEYLQTTLSPYWARLMHMMPTHGTSQSQAPIQPIENNTPATPAITSMG